MTTEEAWVFTERKKEEAGMLAREQDQARLLTDCQELGVMVEGVMKVEPSRDSISDFSLVGERGVGVGKGGGSE